MKKLVVLILTWATKRALARHKPTIVAVTGSVGKTSAKEAIAIVLATKFNVRTAKKNLNTEIGVPLAVLGLDKPSSSTGWISTCWKAMFSKEKDFPTHLVLEFGADRPGDIAHLVKLAPPHVGVVTAISQVHVENYPSFQDLINEKAELVRALPADGLAVLNADDPEVLGMRDRITAPVVTCGWSEEADVVASNYTIETREDNSFAPNESLAAVRFDVKDVKTEETSSVTLREAIGRPQGNIVLFALCVGRFFGIRTSDAIAALEKSYASPTGRMKPLHGIKGSLVLDDSYNAAPASMNAALDVLQDFHPVETARRIAVLGEMAELGSHTEELHRQLGWKAAEMGVDLLVCVGEKSRDTARGAKEAGMAEDQIVLQKNSIDAGRFMDREVKAGDVVLVKGSQSSRMERTVKDLLATPEKANELLVRQEPEWLLR